MSVNSTPLNYLSIAVSLAARAWSHRFFCCSFLLLLLSGPVFSESDVLAQQRAVFDSHQANAEYRFALGSVEKVNAEFKVERELLMTGSLHRKTYEFEQILSVNESWALLEEAYLSGDYQELFFCRGLDCGSSNAWANEVFGIKQLYGLDQSQRYVAYRRDVDGTSIFGALYFVQRGNRRIYAQIDELSLPRNNAPDVTPSYAAILAAFERDGYYSLAIKPASDSLFNQSEVAELIRALKHKPFAKYILRGYHAEKEGGALRSEPEYADSLRSLLVSGGIKETRLSLEKAENSELPTQTDVRARVDIVTLKR